MEKTILGTVISLDAGWRDLGSWDQIWENSQKDVDGNAAQGKVFLKKGIFSDSKYQVLSSASAFILPSHSESFGIGIAELGISKIYQIIKQKLNSL